MVSFNSASQACTFLRQEIKKYMEDLDRKGGRYDYDEKGCIWFMNQIKFMEKYGNGQFLWSALNSFVDEGYIEVSDDACIRITLKAIKELGYGEGPARY